MLALPTAAPPEPKRQLFVGTALASAGAVMLMGGMLAVWMRWRDHSLDNVGTWIPDDVTVPEVTTNVMLIAFLPLVVFAQWAVYSAKRDDKPHTGVALCLTALVALLLINSQVFTWVEMGVVVSSGTYGVMFYALTGTFTVLVLAGLLFTMVAAFRYLAGRESEHEIISSVALYWYAMAFIFAWLWLIVYVTK
jgi:heme/copper-type cytochrome/quinol oxidase subunit 3